MKRTRLLALAIGVILLVGLLLVGTSKGADLGVKATSPLLFSGPVDEVITRNVDGAECYAAPYITGDSLVPDSCTHWTGPGAVEAYWTEEQLEMARGGQDVGLALWGTGAFTITYADGETRYCTSALLGNANVYRLGIPDGIGVGEGYVSGGEPECAYIAPELNNSLTLDLGEVEDPEEAVIKVGKNVLGGGLTTGSEVLIEVGTQCPAWSLVTAESGGQIQELGYYFERNPECVIFLPLISSGQGE